MFHLKAITISLVSNLMKNRLLISVIIILTACLILISGAVFFIGKNHLWEQAIARATATLPNVDVTIQAAGDGGRDSDIPQADTTPEESIPSEIISQMNTIQEQIIYLRGLSPNGTFSRKILSTEQLRQELIETFENEMSAYDSWEYTLTLSIFGLLNEDFDIYHFHIDLLTEQIAGYYDHESQAMVLVAGTQFGGPERLTYAHEYTHALQDQNFDIENGLGYNDEACEGDSERCAAIESLLEGDATLSETQWFLHYATDQDHADLMAFYNDMEMPNMDKAPAFLGEDLLFPYQYGYDFAQNLFERGGWEAVNQAYQNPPVSTEQILHPERYPADVPLPVNLPDLLPILGDGWEEVDKDVIGEWYTYLILAFGLDEEARVNKSRSARAAEGWEGDAYAVYNNAQNQSAAMVFDAIWETPTEAEEFANTFITYATRRFGEPIEQNKLIIWKDENGIHSFYWKDTSTTWIFAPDQVTAESIWRLLQ